jgi:hypothetical protein
MGRAWVSASPADTQNQVLLKSPVGSSKGLVTALGGISREQ